MSVVELRSPTPAEAASLQGLTFPAYRHMLTLQPTHRHPGPTASRHRPVRLLGR